MAWDPIVKILPDTVAKVKGQGALSSLDRNDYDFERSQYPLEGLGTEDAPHYVVFNINLPEHSKYTQSDSGSAASTKSAYQNNFDMKAHQNGIFTLSSSMAESAGGAAAAVGAVSNFQGGDVASKAGNAIAGGAIEAAKAVGGVVISSTVNLSPKTTRIKKSIALYTPDTMITSYDHDWQTISVTEAFGMGYKYAAIGAGAGQFVGDVASVIKGKATGEDVHFNNVKMNSAQKAEALGTAGETLGIVGPGFTDLALRGVGAALNPQFEMVFRGTQNRGYVFEFQFQARSKKEADSISDIIRTFRMYAAPEISSEGSGRYFIPPASFDIKFFFKNVENENIAKISTCALTNIAVNYAGAGQWATFTDGMPVQINLALTFKEMDIITRELIDNYGY